MAEETLRRIDLSKYAQWLEKGDLRFQRAYLSVILLFGLGFLFVGAETQFGGWGPTGYGSADFLFYGLGVTVAVVASAELLMVSHAAVGLVVDEDGLTLTGPDSAERRMSWSDRKTVIEIVDWRSVPVNRRNTRVKELEFVLRPKGKGISLDAGIPFAVAKQIVERAQKSGLAVSGWDDDPIVRPIAHHIWIRYS
ncbi:MAG: hypothetical protein M1144_01250 [Candidatus Thermoplasmatota archaeon]|nr:hypothetical protein [Candidatus Thermoplasmatota archaeon]